jgi:Golgi apparatus protein 1
VADAGEDVRVDQDLYQACQNLITGPCKGLKPGDSRVIKCLLKQRDEPDMTDECDEKLVEIEFFIARDWRSFLCFFLSVLVFFLKIFPFSRLDPEIYKACKNDAKSRCFATTDDWVELGKKDTGEQNIVFSCLYQLALDDEVCKIGNIFIMITSQRTTIVFDLSSNKIK